KIGLVAVTAENVGPQSRQLGSDLAGGTEQTWRIVIQHPRRMSLDASGLEEAGAASALGKGEKCRANACVQVPTQTEHLPFRSAEESRSCQMNHDHPLAVLLSVMPLLSSPALAFGAGGATGSWAAQSSQIRSRRSAR